MKYCLICGDRFSAADRVEIVQVDGLNIAVHDTCEAEVEFLELEEN